MPRIVIGNSEGKGVLKAKVFKGKYEAKLEFPVGGVCVCVGGGGVKTNNYQQGEYGYFLQQHICVLILLLKLIAFSVAFSLSNYSQK